MIVRNQRGRSTAAVVVISLVVAALGLTSPGVARADPAGLPRPTLAVPPDGLKGHPLWDSFYQLEPLGYTEAEYLVSGTATDPDGNTADYTTRMIVTHPVDPADFSGNVMLEWVTSSAQYEVADFTSIVREFLRREGWAWVHVSADARGLCCNPLTPRGWDPVRYAAISHPGDEYAPDMFTQIANLFRADVPPGGIDPLGALGVGQVEIVIPGVHNTGAGNLWNYLNSYLPAHPEAVGLFDGFLIHDAIGAPKVFDVPIPVPVLTLLSDFGAADDGVDPEQDLDPNVRLWEIAGTAHSNYFYLRQSLYGDTPPFKGHVPRANGGDQIGPEAYADMLEELGVYGEVITPWLGGCFLGGDAFPMHYAASTALAELERWARGGDPPSHGPRFEFAGGTLARDGDGNALGGIRLPPIDVPVASYQSVACYSIGITVPFTDLELAQRYGSHSNYMALMAERTDAAVEAGWLLPADAVDLMRRACNAVARWEPSATPDCDPYEPPVFRSVGTPHGRPGHGRPPSEGWQPGDGRPPWASAPARTVTG